MNFSRDRRARSAFTLIELLTVIAIIVVLMGLLFPAITAVKEQAKKTQAKNDLTQIVNAIRAFYTEYGQYPCGAQTGADANDYVAADDNTQNILMDVLRVPSATNGNVTTYNPRQVVFVDAPVAKDPVNPKNGIGGSGRWYDPWGNAYRVKIDNNYNNQLLNPYSANAGFATLNTGVIAWSIGKDKGGAVAGTAAQGDKNTGTYADDVLSWQ